MDSYSHITLTDDERLEGELWALQQKEARLKHEANQRRINENRRRLMGTTWDIDQTRGFALSRAGQIFNGAEFVIDDKNRLLFSLLCAYFADDPAFISLAKGAEVKNPSLNKGIFLTGNFGVGKTWMMRLFAKNKRQVFHVKNSKDIANAYEQDGGEAIAHYTELIPNAYEDPNCFFQAHAGLCLDDIGTEDIKVNYGNRRSVIGDLIEQRYNKGTAGIFMHATTNLTAEQLKEFYGGRVIDRMREIFNFIELGGNTRRV